MRVTEIHIDRWRNLRDIHFEVPESSTLISLVGSNGTGKTNLLELLAYASGHLGLSPGVSPRQRPMPPPDSEFNVVLEISEAVECSAEMLVAHLQDSAEDVYRQWDRTLTLWHLSHVHPEPPPGYPRGQAGSFVVAGGVDPNLAHIAAVAIVQFLHRRLELNHLFLDADRSLGLVPVQDQEILAASREDPSEPALARQRAMAAMPGMYQDWIRSMLGLEHRHAASFAHAHRNAHLQGTDGPSYEDPWLAYREAVQAVMPHLSFSRPDQDQRTLTFEAGGTEIPYHELSGGEREVAFLIGQLLRFKLSRGILLLDEPELHLNAELLERWLKWATHVVTDGQVWIATHSLEAVEVAGPDSAVVFERDSDGLVRQLDWLSNRPLFSTLAGALGSPAFSLDRQRFVLIEGERPGRERVRFASLCPGDDNLFLEAGNCRQVVDKLAVVGDVATETDRLSIGGIVDRDHWNARQREQMVTRAPVHVLGVHEVENFFLFPEALSLLARRSGDKSADAVGSLRLASDRFAGLWIAQRAAVRHDIDLGQAFRKAANGLDWSSIDNDRGGTLTSLAALADLDDEDLRPKVLHWLERALEGYERLRESEDLWMGCSGKQVVGVVASALGLAGAPSLEKQVLALLADEAVEPPVQLVALREYVAGLT